MDDDTYNKDADDWEDNLTLHKKHIADLQRQLGELAKVLILVCRRRNTHTHMRTNSIYFV